MISKQPDAAEGKCSHCKGTGIKWFWSSVPGVEWDFHDCGKCGGTGHGGKSQSQAIEAEARDIDKDHGSGAEGIQAASGGKI